jgi:general secretion pathway protein D
MHFLRAGAFLLMALLLVTASCRPKEPAAAPGPSVPPRGRTVVETYPAPVDPSAIVRREPAAVPEPKVIENGGKATLIYTCRNARSEVLKEAMENLVSPEGSVEASPRLNALIISDAKDLIQGLLSFVRELDRPTPQLLVEARIVEVTLDSDLEYELQHVFSHPAGGVDSVLQGSRVKLEAPGSNPNITQGSLLNLRPWSTDSKRLDDFIRLLVTKGQAKILSSPNLIVSTGTEASLITGEEVPIQSATVVSGSVSTTTQFKRVGIKLRVTPLQIAGDTARVEINPEVSTVTGFTAAGASGVSNPIVAIRNVRTTLALKDGEILTIGGLLRSEDRKVVRKVPGLGDIPLLGLLFQSRRNQQVKTQLVFFLRVNILDEGRPHSIRLRRPGAGLELLDEEVGRFPPDSPEPGR